MSRIPRPRPTSGALILETDREPPAVVIDKVLNDSELQGAQLTVILTPHERLRRHDPDRGARAQVALHKAHFLGFPLARIVEGAAAAPACLTPQPMASRRWDAERRNFVWRPAST